MIPRLANKPIINTRGTNEGTILRAHVMRPTWHFVTPADIRWLPELTAPRVNVANGYMYRQWELDETQRKCCSLSGFQTVQMSVMPVSLASKLITPITRPSTRNNIERRPFTSATSMSEFSGRLR